MKKKMLVHCQHDDYEVYIGRGRDPRSGEAGRWGNPFRIGEDGTRDEVLGKYRLWICKEVEAGRIELSDLAALHGKVLGCWCAPERCHGEILARWARRAYEEIYG